MRIPLPHSSECIIEPNFFSKEAHAPLPEKLLLRIRQLAPNYVKMPGGDEKFDFDLIVQLKFAAMGDWVVLYQGLYELSSKYEFIRCLADIAQEVLLLCHTPIETLDDYILTYDRDKFTKLTQYLPTISINTIDNPFSNRAFPDPSDSNKYYPKLSKMNKMDFKVMQWKLKRGDFATIEGTTGEIDMEAFANIENQIKFAKSERMRIQNVLQNLFAEQQQLSEKIRTLDQQRTQTTRKYDNEKSQYEIQKITVPSKPDEITQLQNQIDSIGSVQSTCLGYVGEIKTWSRQRQDHWNFVYDKDGKQKWWVLEKDRKPRRDEIDRLDHAIASKKASITSTLNKVGVSLSDLPSEPDEIIRIINSSCGTKIGEFQEQMNTKKDAYDEEVKKISGINQELEMKIQKIVNEKKFELTKINEELTALNNQMKDLQTQLKIKDELVKLNNEIVQLQQKFNILQAGYDVQTQIEAQKEIDANLRKELEENIKKQLETQAQRVADLKNKIEQRKVEAKKQIEAFRETIQKNRTEREQQLQKNINETEETHKKELTNLMTQLQMEQQPQKKKLIEEKITRLFEQKASKIEQLKQNVETANTLDNEELSRLERIEKEQQENEQWELEQLEKVPEILNNQLKEFDEQAEKRIKNIQMESGLETPINLTPTVLLTRILRNIEYYYNRIYDELPLIFKDSSVVPKMNTQYILPPRLFLNYHHSLLTFKDQEEADTYISDILVPPGGTREVTITMSRISKETTESKESIITSTDEKAVDAFTNTFNKAQGMKKSLSTEAEKYNAARSSFEAGAKVSVKSNPAVNVDAHADFKTDSESTQRTNNKNSQDQYLDEVQNTVSSHTNEINKKNQKEVSVKQTFELTESKESKEYLRFVNTNYEKAMKIKFYQATQLYKCFIMLDDIDLEFTNGFEVKSVLIRQLEDLPLNWGETGKEPIFLEGVKRYIYIAGETKTFTGEIYHFFTEKLTRNPIYVFRLPTKDENFYGVPIRYFTQNILLDAVTTKTELDSTLLLDQFRKTELETQMEQIKWNTELVKQQALNTQIKNRILTQIADVIATKPQELDLADAINAIIATTSQGIEYIQKPFTIDYLSKKKNQNLLMLEKKQEQGD